MSVNWLKFWNYVVLPVFLLASLYDLSQGFYLAVLDLGAVGFLIYGLHKRLGWSYYLNWAVILLKYVVAVLPNIYDRAQQPGVMVYSVGLKMVLFALLLLLPNYFYWTKRKHLFVN